MRLTSLIVCGALLVACDDEGDTLRQPDASAGGGDASARLDAASIPDAGASDAAQRLDAASTTDTAANVDASFIPGVEAGVAACDFGPAGSAATSNMLNLFGEIVYLNGGQPIPAGRYVATIIDGCFKYSGNQGWTVHAYRANDPTPLGWYAVGNTSNDHIARLPGTIGYAVGGGAYADFEECVTANKNLPPVEFDHPGGKLGVWLNDSNYGDNLVGVNGRNPKWQFARLGACQ